MPDTLLTDRESEATIVVADRPKMRGSSSMKLLSVCCGGFMIAMPVADATKAFYDYRSDADRANPFDLGCGESFASHLGFAVRQHAGYF